jgi:hypothetical protein
MSASDITRTVIDQQYPASTAKKPDHAAESISAKLTALAHAKTLAVMEVACKRARRCGRYDRVATRDVEAAVFDLAGTHPIFLLANQSTLLPAESQTAGKILCLRCPKS